MSGAARLYTPELLGLAVRLANYPPDDALALQGAARSPSCGSTLAIGLSLDEEGKVSRVGMKVHACAVGQAAAAIFADAVLERDAAAIPETLEALERWLAGEGAMPDWPGLPAIEPAYAYPARHGAMLLPWRAAAQALSKLDSTR